MRYPTLKEQKDIGQQIRHRAHDHYPVTNCDCKGIAEACVAWEAIAPIVAAEERAAWEFRSKGLEDALVKIRQHAHRVAHSDTPDYRMENGRVYLIADKALDSMKAIEPRGDL